MNINGRECLGRPDDAAPTYFGVLEVDQEANGEAGGVQVAEALGQVEVGEAIDAFQLDDQVVLN